MTEPEFWALVERCKAPATEDGCDDSAELLQAALSAMDATEILAFRQMFQARMNLAYTWDLWGAAFVINGGCSDDGFEYFRAWLVMQGADTFLAALKDPEFLVNRVGRGGVECEAVLYAPFNAYKRVANAALPAGPSQPTEPVGEPWDEEDLDARFPQLTKAFG